MILDSQIQLIHENADDSNNSDEYSDDDLETDIMGVSLSKM